MDVEDIEVIGLQPLQTQLDLPHCIIAPPRCDLGGKNDLLPSLAHQLSNALFTLLSPIVVSRVHICDSEVERLAERLKSLIFLVIHHEPASRTECQHRNRQTGSAKSSSRDLRGCTQRLADCAA